MPVSRSRVIAVLVLTIAAFGFLPSDSEAQTEGEYLYKVSLLRAAPGHYDEFVAALEESFALSEEAGDSAPFWIRHSQGDHWDFMVITPMDDWATYYSADRVERRAAVSGRDDGRRVRAELAAVTSYEEEWFARSAPLDVMSQRFDGMGLFHIEMFAGLPGQRDQLLHQRRMENLYYDHLGRQLNVLFVRDGGSNWDAMTIGFYETLQAYAGASLEHSAEEQEEAAQVAGFTGTSEIGPYLRSLLSYHRDTLGVRAR